jgi:hypothetical protein
MTDFRPIHVFAIERSVLGALGRSNSGRTTPVQCPFNPRAMPLSDRPCTGLASNQPRLESSRALVRLEHINNKN